MIDIEFKKYYNDIMDPSWPQINNYFDFVQLPPNIQLECKNLHNLDQRKNQICDPTYWAHQTVNVCVYKDLAFVPVSKCAYVYNTTIFTNLGWKMIPLSEIDFEKTNFFGTIVHPLTRRLKGLTQWLVECYKIEDDKPHESNPWIYAHTAVNWAQLKIDLSLKPLRKLVETVGVGDEHSAPYSAMFGELLSKINWIPMDLMTDNQVKRSMMNFFQLHNHNIQLPFDDPRLHVSCQEQLEVFDIVKTIFYSSPNNLFYLYKLYGNDLTLYYNLLDTFTQDWQHI